MNATVTKQSSADWFIPLGIAVLSTLLLFYIDEGYYDFRWMKDAGNWFVFVIYVGIITAVQWLLGFLFFRKSNGFIRGIGPGLIGLVLGLALVFGLLS